MSQYINNFIESIIDEDLNNKKYDEVQTRFPPEPNGFLHIGHAKSICLNFAMAENYSGKCNLRFDDTNPEKENDCYMEAIKSDVHWLGFGWDKLCYASDYFDNLYNIAVKLIKQGDAYVDDQSAEDIQKGRGTLTEPGVNSPFRERSVSENLDLFEKMKEGLFKDGEKVLRAKINMASPNINMRDPVLYRIRNTKHYRTKDNWCIYPMYDFTHGLSDMIEGVTHSLCTLEFQDHRPLYDWFLDKLNIPSEKYSTRPGQIEFSRLNMEYTILSKRKLIQLVDEGYVSGWDDPRMPTISGLRRRGVPASAVRELCYQLGVNKKDVLIEISFFENIIREHLNKSSNRRMAVMKPLKLTLSNYPKDKTETLVIKNHPQDEEKGVREVSFSKHLYIEKDDFMIEPEKGFKRLTLDKEIRLRGSYVIRCDKVIYDDSGEILELIGSYDPKTLGKNPEGRKVKGVIHWVDAKTAVDAEINEYGRLLSTKNPSACDNFLDCIEKDSHKVIKGAKLEKELSFAKVGETYQFERVGYYTLDYDSSNNKLIFNSTISLREG